MARLTRTPPSARMSSALEERYEAEAPTSTTPNDATGQAVIPASSIQRIISGNRVSQNSNA